MNTPSIVPEPSVAAELPGIVDRIARSLLTELSRTTPSRAGQQADAQRMIRAASTRSALLSGTLALPVGPAGWITLLPEMYALWRIQAQLVADLAGAHGRELELRREHMLWCMFRHSSVQVVRDLAVRVGGRWLVQQAPSPVFERVAGGIARQLAGAGLQRATARWLPLIGAASAGACAWYDTSRVGRSALELFSAEPLEDAGPHRRRLKWRTGLELAAD